MRQKADFRRITLLIIAAQIIFMTACGTAVSYSEDIQTTIFTDSSGRKVEIPTDITRVAPSGSVATMILATICPEYMVSVSSTPSSSQYKYLPERLLDLPTTGQLYGSRSTINLESLLKASPQIIIDLGDRKDNIASDMNTMQRTIGIATVFIEADLPNLASAYRTLGEILGLSERAETLASFIDETMEMAETNRSQIAENERKSVMYTSGPTGLNTNAYGSVQAQVFEIIGAVNAIVVDDVSNAGGGNIIDLEQLYNFDPEVILFAGSSIYDIVDGMPAWTELYAIRNNTYYEIPELPYNWMASPPSINMILGIWWSGNLLYPQYYDYDVADIVKQIYSLFWDYELTDTEIQSMLQNSTMKAHNYG